MEGNGSITAQHVERAIEEHLLGRGWLKGNPEHFDRALALDPAELLRLIAESQAAIWTDKCPSLLARPRGFESAERPVISRVYGATQGDGRGSTLPADASGRVPTDHHEADDRVGENSLLRPTADLFIHAGLLAAVHAAKEHAPWSEVEEILRRAVDQSAALRGEEV